MEINFYLSLIFTAIQLEKDPFSLDLNIQLLVRNMLNADYYLNYILFVLRHLDIIHVNSKYHLVNRQLRGATSIVKV